MTQSGTGYNWTNTSQWSKVPTAPIVQNSTPNNSINNQTQSFQPTGQVNNNQMNYFNTSQESRKDMISRLYRFILGREPDIAGLNYYLYNTQLSEAQISKEMYESTEHADLVSKAKDIREMVKVTEDATKKMKDMEYNLQSLQVLNDNYKSLLEQKTQIINQMRQQIQPGNEYQITEPNFRQTSKVQSRVDRQNYSENNNSSNNSQEFVNRPEIVQESDGTYMLQDPFEDEYSSRQGCMAWVKSWFKFV